MTKVNAPGSDGTGSASCADFPSLQVHSFSVWLHPEIRYRSELPPVLNLMEVPTTALGVELAVGAEGVLELEAAGSGGLLQLVCPTTKINAIREIQE